MGKRRFKIISFFLRLMLLSQIYSHQCFKAEATENRFTEILDECKHGEEADLINDKIPDKDPRLSVVERPKRPARLLPLKIIR